MTEGEKWILGCTIIMALCTIGALVISIIAVTKKTNMQVYPDPLNVRKTPVLVAEKDCFLRHAESTTGIKQLHQQLVDLEKSRETQRELASREMGGIYKHIESVRRELSEKIDNQPEALISILQKTKARFDE